MRWVIVAVVAALVLSGCSGSGDSDGDSTGTSKSGTTTKGGSGGGGSTTTGSGGGGGGSGSGQITVNLNRTTIDGPAPLKVNFTLSATFKGADGKPATPKSTITVTYRQTEAANGTALTGPAEKGPTVTSLPATFSLTFENVGKYEVTATIKASGYKDGQDTVVILPRAPGTGGPGGEPIFFDGAEGDASQWTLSSKVLIVDFFGNVPVTETPVDHPTGKWQISDKEAHTGSKSFWSDYPDNYRGRMVSLAVNVPGNGGELSFWYKGGAESNGYDGLFVYVNGSPVVEALAGLPIDWTRFAATVPGGEVTLEFRFDSDPSCSSVSGAPAGCGDGWDAGGFYIDDIAVA